MKTINEQLEEYVLDVCAPESEEEKERIMEDLMYIEASTDTELAENYIDMIGGIESLSKEDLARYFDFESFGRDLSYDFTKMDNIYISNY